MSLVDDGQHQAQGMLEGGVVVLGQLKEPGGRGLQLVLPALVAALTIWLTYGISISLDMPGEVLRISANLLTAWVIIRLATSLIRQRGWASLVTTIVWSVAALALLDLLEPFYVLLDSVAFSAGDFRVSLLGIINSIILFGLFILAANFLIRLADDRMARLEGVSAAARVLITKILRIALIIAATIVALLVAAACARRSSA